MNWLGILIDITHGTEAVHKQLIETSKAPVVASHETIRAVSGVGLSDEVLKALAAKGGLVGIHGGAAVVGKRYRKWLSENPEKAAANAKGLFAMVGYQPDPRPPGVITARQHRRFRQGIRRAMARRRQLEGVAGARATHSHGRRMGRARRLRDQASGRRPRRNRPRHGWRTKRRAEKCQRLPELVAALNRITTPANVKKIAGENWLRVLGTAKT